MWSALCSQCHIMDSAGQINLRFCLLVRGCPSICPYHWEISRIRSIRQYSNWKPPLFRFCNQKLDPRKYCWSHNQKDTFPVNMASRFSDLKSPAGIMEDFFSRALRGEVCNHFFSLQLQFIALYIRTLMLYKYGQSQRLEWLKSLSLVWRCLANLFNFLTSSQRRSDHSSLQSPYFSISFCLPLSLGNVMD